MTILKGGSIASWVLEGGGSIASWVLEGGEWFQSCVVFL
jgi:hypothetical protein